MNNKEIIEEFKKGLSKVIKKYTKNGYFDLVDGYIPLESFILKVLAQQKEELNKKWEKKTIIIPKGKLHPVHDRCEECISIGRQEMREEFKENMTQIVIEDVPHRYQSRLLKTLKQ